MNITIKYVLVESYFQAPYIQSFEFHHFYLILKSIRKGEIKFSKNIKLSFV